ncbi:MAG: hypothetical protein HOV73_25915 [Streptomyces sp.]|nr:hypothetical protein [Streptomyces sp.]NUR43523.1 hypothetical protein [Streptomyces sp.]NUS15217.1 hypothetical protein [Streptomyces sp.]NUS25557.1 hypothetical protein [Streptomyces sp.]NUS77352.1 hypothetical protein [Streptomyces sp.]
MHELNCPACHGRRNHKHQLCPACWRALPAATRGRLALNDPYAHIRRHQLRAQLKDHTPLGVIRVSR